MNERKTLGFDWEFGHEEVALEVGSYMYGDNLYIGMYTKQEGVWESFGDITVNLPYNSVEPNEAYIDDFSSKDKLKLVRKYKLGKVLPEKGHSGYCDYFKVAFDLDKLAEFDKEGVEKFRKLHGIPEKQKQKKRAEQER